MAAAGGGPFPNFFGNAPPQAVPVRPNTLFGAVPSDKLTALVTAVADAAATPGIHEYKKIQRINAAIPAGCTPEQRRWFTAHALLTPYAAALEALAKKAIDSSNPFVRPFEDVLHAYGVMMQHNKQNAGELYEIWTARENATDHANFVGKIMPPHGVRYTLDNMNRRVGDVEVAPADEIPPSCCINVAFWVGRRLFTTRAPGIDWTNLRATLSRFFGQSTRMRALQFIVLASEINDAGLLRHVVYDSIHGTASGGLYVDPNELFLSKSCVDAMSCGFFYEMYNRATITVIPGGPAGELVANELVSAFFATYTDLTNARCDMADAVMAGCASVGRAWQAAIADETIHDGENGQCQLVSAHPSHTIAAKMVELYRNSRGVPADDQAVLNVFNAVFTGMAGVARLGPVSVLRDQAHIERWADVAEDVARQFLDPYNPHQYRVCVEFGLRDASCATGAIHWQRLLRNNHNIEPYEPVSTPVAIEKFRQDFKMTRMAKRLLGDLLVIAVSRPRGWTAVPENHYDHCRVYGAGYFGNEELVTFRVGEEAMLGNTVALSGYVDEYITAIGMITDTLNPKFDGQNHGALNVKNIPKYVECVHNALQKRPIEGFDYLMELDRRYPLVVAAFIGMRGLAYEDAPTDTSKLGLWRFVMCRYIMTKFGEEGIGTSLGTTELLPTSPVANALRGTPLLSTCIGIRGRFPAYTRPSISDMFMDAVVYAYIRHTFDEWDAEKRRDVDATVITAIMAGADILDMALRQLIETAIRTSVALLYHSAIAGTKAGAAIAKAAGETNLWGGHGRSLHGSMDATWP